MGVLAAASPCPRPPITLKPVFITSYEGLLFIFTLATPQLLPSGPCQRGAAFRVGWGGMEDEGEGKEKEEGTFILIPPLRQIHFTSTFVLVLHSNYNQVSGKQLLRRRLKRWGEKIHACIHVGTKSMIGWKPKFDQPKYGQANKFWYLFGCNPKHSPPTKLF